MFLKDDIYTSSGSLKLFHCWTDKVTKFDSSSFYNWEQDNLPVYDLEERTFYLWEQMGYPTSSIPGVALVVSADAPTSAVQCNKNIFKTVSAAVEALPQIINFPIVIEVGSFGNLGNLVLNNYKFGPRGSLEIINRNFAKADAWGYYGISSLGLTPNDRTLNGMNIYATTANYYSYAASVTLESTLSSLGLGYAFSPMGHFIDTSCLSISCAVFSSTTDSRLTNNLNAVASVLRNDSSTKLSKSTLSIDYKNNLSPFTVTSGILAFKPYDMASENFDLINTYDVSTLDLLNNKSHLYINDSSENDKIRAIFFGNKLNKIIVNNCDGPIYIRNFFCDGSGYLATNNFVGVEVTNSNNIFLENIVSTRNRRAGFEFNNSKVNILRGCVATRNYNFDVSGKRLTGPWVDRISFSMQNSTSGYLYDDDSAGIIANNSIITLSSTASMEAKLQLDYLNSKYPGVLSSFYPYVNSNYILESSKNSNGIILNNSIFTGGDISGINEVLGYKYKLNFDIYNNVGYGIKSSNSKISFDGRFNVFENLNGIFLDSSTFEIDKLILRYNQKYGLNCVNSNVIYNKNLIASHQLGTRFESKYAPIFFSGNGQHLILNNSKMLPVMTMGMDTVYGELTFGQPIGKRDSSKQIIPSIEITNNSEAVLVSPYLTRDVTHAGDAGFNQPCKGSEIHVNNNSKATIKGTKWYATRIFGPTTRSHANMAAVYAGNNSIVEINGPTAILQYGVNLLADSHSTININPHKSSMDGSYDVSSFTLSDSGNHTAVELHATRSCIVIDNHSELNIRDLGSYKQCWERSTNIYSALDLSGLDYTIPINNFENFISGGSLQFYPSPIGDYAIPALPSTPLNSTRFLYNSYTANPGYYYLKNQATTTDPFTYSSITNGGFCVRALNNSVVNVHNVNFPCGWWQTSAPYYDASMPTDSGGFCYRTFIWNIADNSQLKSSYLSVSGLYPRLAGYFGPSGAWTSGSPLKIASGLPTTTLDTSTASILDFFGAIASSGNPYGKQTAQNYGPFRLYFSVNPATYALKDVNSTGTYGILPQIYSQGYQPSASMICDTQVTSTYTVLLQRNSSNNIVPSGYYYGSAMLDTNGYTRVLLDESAAETFANAKHCSVGKSGNAKLVSIHYPYTLTQFGASYNNRGIKSINTFDLERDN